MTTANSTYESAITFAETAYSRFVEQHERVMSRYERGEGHTNLTALMERDRERYAAETCAQQELIMFMFGVSEEKVHEDLEAERAMWKGIMTRA